MTGTRASRRTRSTRLLPPRGTSTSMRPSRPPSMSPTAARSVVGTSCIAVSGRSAAASPATRQRVDRRRRTHALAPAAQDRGVPGLEAQRARIRGHVRPALVDDADDAERHAHALDHAGRSGVATPRSRCRSDPAARRCPRGRAPWPRCAHRRARDGRAKRRLPMPCARRRDRPRCRKESARFVPRSSPAAARSAASLAALPARESAPAAAAASSPMRVMSAGRSPFAIAAAVTDPGQVRTRSSRWIISSRPRNPSSSSSSELRRPRIRSASPFE